MKFRREITILLESCTQNDSAAGELYIQPAKQGGTYLTVMLHGLDDLHTQSVLCIKNDTQSKRFPLPVPCQGKVELCLWSCLEMASIVECDFSVCNMGCQTVLASKKS